MFAQREYEVLWHITRGLRAGEEEGQAFVNDPQLSVFEEVIAKDRRQKIAVSSRLRVGLQLNFPLVDNILAELTQCGGISLHVFLIGEKEYIGKVGEECDVRFTHSIDEILERVQETVADGSPLSPSVDPVIDLIIFKIDSKCTLKHDSRRHFIHLLYNIDLCPLFIRILKYHLVVL